MEIKILLHYGINNLWKLWNQYAIKIARNDKNGNYINGDHITFIIKSVLINDNITDIDNICVWITEHINFNKQ